MLDNPIIAQQERANNRIPYRRPIDLFDPCECGVRDAAAIYKGTQRLCAQCLEGIVEVRIL